MRRLLLILAVLGLIAGGLVFYRFRDGAELKRITADQATLTGDLQLRGQSVPVQAVLQGPLDSQITARELLDTLQRGLQREDGSPWQANLAMAAKDLQHRLGNAALERLQVGNRDSEHGFSSTGEREGLPPAKSVHPVLLIGIDGADWQVLEPLLYAGRLPHLAALYQSGARAILRGQRPLLSPLLWTTMATGVDPYEHGIKDFVNAGAPVSSVQRKVPAFWNLFSALGVPSMTVAWWASWPAEWVRGSILSDRVAYSLFDAARPETGELAHPMAWGSRAAKVASETEVPDELLQRFVRISPQQLTEARQLEKAGDLQDPVPHLIRTLRGMRAYHQLALQLMQERPAPVAAVYYQAVDEVCHRFAAARPPALPGHEADQERYGNAVDAAYLYQDELLGELIARFRSVQGENARILIVSDHGFMTGLDRPRNVDSFSPQTASLWHRPEGIFLASGPGIARGQRPDLEQTQILPILMAAAGVAPPAQLRGRVPEGLFQEAPAPVPWPDLLLQQTILPEASEAGQEADAQRLEELRRLGYIGDQAAQTASVNTAMVDSLHFHRLGQKDKAFEILRTALQTTQYDGTIASNAANLALELKRFPEAEQILNEIERRGQGDESLPILRGLVWRGLGSSPQDVAAKLEPMRAQHALGVALARIDLALESGWPELSVVFGEALALQPESPLLAARLERFPRPVPPELLEPALASFQANPQALRLGRWLGQGLLESRKAPEARTVFRLLLQSEPADRQLIEQWATAALMSGDTAAVLRELEAVSRAEAHTSGTRAVLATAYAISGRSEDSIREYRRLVTEEPSRMQFYAPLGQLLLQTGKPQEALEILDRGLAIAQGKPEESVLRSLRERAAQAAGKP